MLNSVLCRTLFFAGSTQNFSKTLFCIFRIVLNLQAYFEIEYLFTIVKILFQFQKQKYHFCTEMCYNIYNKILYIKLYIKGFNML